VRYADKIAGFPIKFLDGLNKKTSKLEEKLVAKTEKVLTRLERHEQKLRKKLNKKDSVAASQLLGNTEEQYKVLRQMADRNSATLSRSSLNNYIPNIDTLKNSLNFLGNQSEIFLKQNGIDQKEIQSAYSKQNSVDSRLQQANIIREILKQRREDLKQKLLQFGLVKEYTKYSKQVYYYSKKLNEYKEIIKDPSKIEEKAVSLIQKLPAFQKFFKEHSELASLFPESEFYGTGEGLQGLQARVDVQALMQNRIQTGGPKSQQLIQQNIQAAQSQLNQLKDKVNKTGGNSSDIEMPDFKPNTQRSKSLFQRIELGTNIQNTRSSSFTPTSTDFGLSAGFKINDQSIIGLGMSYRAGWGKDIRHISITHEGFGVRGFLDYKLYRSFYVSGGYEYNYRMRFDNVQQLGRTPENWSSSALLGINKKYSIGKKWKGDMKLLFDFLYRQHIPVSVPVIFRLGYSFK